MPSLSLSLCICLSTYMPICLSFFLSFYLPTCLPTYECVRVHHSLPRPPRHTLSHSLYLPMFPSLLLHTHTHTHTQEKKGGRERERESESERQGRTNRNTTRKASSITGASFSVSRAGTEAGAWTSQWLARNSVCVDKCSSAFARGCAADTGELFDGVLAHVLSGVAHVPTEKQKYIFM